MVEEDTREKAIERIKTELYDYLTNEIEMVPIDIPIPSKTGNPWLDNFGCFKDDPTFDDLQNEIAAYRLEIDNQGMAE